MDPRLQFAIKVDYDERWFHKVIDDAETVAQGVKAAGDRMGAGINGASSATSNLVAQLNDIGTTLAGGSSPFLVALQQGGQISQVLGPMGAGGAAKALGSAFLSLLSPINVLTIGTIALGGAAFQWLMSLNQESPSAEDRLKAHAEWLHAILVGYENATDAADRHLQEVKKLPQAAVESDLTKRQVDMVKELDDQLQKLKTTRDSYVEDKTKIFWEAPEAIAQANAIAKLQDELSQTNPDLEGFIESLTELKNSAVNDKIARITQGLIDMAQATRETQAGITSTGEALRELGAINPDFSAGIKALSSLGVAAPTDRERAASARDQAMGNDTDINTRIAVMKEYNDALARIKTREDEQEALKLGKEGEALAKRQAETYQTVIDALDAERSLVGLSAAEAEKLNQVRAAGVEVGSKEAETIRDKVQALQDAQDAQAAIDAMATPADQAEKDIARLKDLLDAGLIDWETYAHGVEVATSKVSAGMGGMVGKVGDILGSLASIMQSSGEEQFGIAKGLSVAMAVLKGYEAVTSAYAAGAAIPGGGPITGALYAAAAAAATAAQIANILSTTSKSTSMKGTASGGAATPAATAPATAGVTQGVNISLYGSHFSGQQVLGLFGQLQDALGMQGKMINVTHINGA